MSVFNLLDLDGTALEELRHRLAVPRAERVDRGAEHAFVQRQRRHRRRACNYLIEQRSILFSHGRTSTLG